MGRLGINVVRIGEFAWSIIEPVEGKIDFSLFDRAMDVLAENGIKVIMGTPTATPPAWLIKKYPEILQVDEKGIQKNFGSRKHYCFNSPIYREYSLNITKEYVLHFKGNPNVIAWQLDNEYGCHSTIRCYCDNCARAWREWLRAKYASIDRLNRDWGTVFWSQIYNDWSEIDPPRHTVASHNPSLLLDYARFSSDSVLDYHQSQYSFLKANTDQPVTHNLMVSFTEMDYKKLAEKLDFVSWDNYILGDYDNDIQGMNHDLMRSLGGKPFLVMEQQPGRVNWRKVNVYHPPEEFKYWLMQSFAHGASGSIVFRYRQLPYGAEQFHGGLVNYDGRLTERATAFREFVDEIKKYPELVPSREIGIYFDYENQWISKIDNLNSDFDLLGNGVLPLYKAVKALGYNVDFVFADSNLEDYQAIIVPSAFKLDTLFLERMKKYSGIMIFSAMTCQKNSRNFINTLSTMKELCGAEVIDSGGLQNSIEIRTISGKLEGRFVAEVIEPGPDMEIIGRFQDYPFKGKPAITRKGQRIYVATVPTSKSAEDILEIAGIRRRLKGAVEIVNLEEFSLIMNPSPEARDFLYEGQHYTLAPFSWTKAPRQTNNSL